MSVQAGTREMWLGQIYDRYVGVVFRYCCLRSGTRRGGEYLTAAAFRRARRQSAAVASPDGDPVVWLLGLARRAAAEYDIDQAPGITRYDVAEGEDLVLLEAVKRLSPDQQDCIVLRVLMGMSPADTAQVMDRKQASIGSLQYQSLRALARHFRGGPDDLR